MKSLKKAYALLLVLVCIFLSGCSFGVIVHNEENITVVINDSTTAVTKKTQSGESTAKSTAEATSTTASSMSTPSTATPSTATSTATTSAAPSTTKKRKKGAATKKEKTTAKSTSATTKQNKEGLYCVITVECKSILSNMDRLKEGHEKYVPKDGYIIKNYKYKFKNGDTVYTVLKAAAKANGVTIAEKSTIYGKYISGINNLDEFDVGQESGWTYYVNGKFAQVSCDNYKVAENDNIVFSYTCKKS